MWVGMSLRDAVARAGSFDDLRPDLEEGRIMARADGFYSSAGRPRKHAYADGRIPADWWEKLCDVVPAANRSTFRVSTFSFVGSGPDDKVKSYLDDILAIGIELERAAVEALFPKAPMPVETSRLEERLELLPADQARVEAPRPEETETPTPQDLGGTPSPSKQEETDFAIESAAQELRANPKLTRDQLYERLFGPKDKRAPSLKEKNWVTGWTVSRFRKKVWARARERAGLPLLAPKGRRPEK